MGLSKSEKDKQLKQHPKCYVCSELGYPHSSFKGYDRSEIQFDHWKPQGLIGQSQADLVENQYPVHAHPDGLCYQDDGFESATKRNCHKGKGARFASGSEWVIAVGIWRKALKVQYSDDLMPTRKRDDDQFKVEVEWNVAPGHVRFDGETYPMMEQQIEGGQVWRSFATVVPAELLWRDMEVQSRPADTKRVAEMAIHLRKSPLLSPILCRLAGGYLNVFDGNHRLSAFLLARPHQGVPVTIFEGPDPKVFLEVVGQAHDEMTQQKYQYTAKALKYSALNSDELARAVQQHGVEASEKLAWGGLTAKEARLRIVGKITHDLDKKDKHRVRWQKAGLTDKSWNDFLAAYARLAAVDAPFQSPEYHRDHEIANLQFLCRVFDEELFDRLGDVPEAKASLKTKWWKAAHKRLSTRLAQVLRDSMKLAATPKDPAYVPHAWDTHVQLRVRTAVKRWTDSPAWRSPTTANNEPDVVKHLDLKGFTETYLME